MLQESRLYSFIDHHNGFLLQFLEGQKLIHDLVLIHGIAGQGFQYYRDSVLAFQTMISYLKPGEGLGIYLDSEEPYFRLKIEMSDEGQMRTLLLPEEFKEFPHSITGKCRIVKLLPGEVTPYTSIVNLDQNNSEEVINKVLNDSYQVKSRVFISQDSDQSVMITKLPNKNVDKFIEENTTSIPEYWLQHQSHIQKLFASGTSDQLVIQENFEKNGFLLLGSREIKFKCTCSRQRMFDGVRSIIMSAGIEHVFAPDESEIQTKCDYCKETYIFTREAFNLLN